MDDEITKSSFHVRKSNRSKSSYSDTDEKMSKRKRSNSYRNNQEDDRSTRSKKHQSSRSKSRSRSYISLSGSNDSSYSRSYRSRSISRSPENQNRRKKSKHRRRSMSWSNNSSPVYESKDCNLSPSSRHSKDKKKSKDPRDKSKRESWKNKVYIVGEIMKDSVFHFCDTCQMPIFIYCRLIPCKHIFCYSCGSKYQDKKCPRCEKKVLQLERCNFGSVFMCYQGGAQHGSQGCRRTYLSQRDLDSHINHRHNKGTPTSSQQLNNNPCPLMSMSVPPPLNMLGPTFINSFPGQFQQHQIQSMLQQQQQQMPINSIQNQQMTSMNVSHSAQMIRPMGNMLANINNQSLSVNQQQINSNQQSQMVNHQQNFSLQMQPMNMMQCNMGQNTLSMINQNTQNMNNSVVTGNMGLNNGGSSNNGSGQQMMQGGMYLHGGGPSSAGNHRLMGATNQGYSGAGHPPPLMAHLTSLLQGMGQAGPWGQRGPPPGR